MNEPSEATESASQAEAEECLLCCESLRGNGSLHRCPLCSHELHEKCWYRWVFTCTSDLKCQRCLRPSDQKTDVQLRKDIGMLAKQRRFPECQEHLQQLLALCEPIAKLGEKEQYCARATDAFLRAHSMMRLLNEATASADSEDLVLSKWQAIEDSPNALKRLAAFLWETDPDKFDEMPVAVGLLELENGQANVHFLLWKAYSAAPFLNTEKALAHYRQARALGHPETSPEVHPQLVAEALSSFKKGQMDRCHRQLEELLCLAETHVTAEAGIRDQTSATHAILLAHIMLKLVRVAQTLSGLSLTSENRNRMFNFDEARKQVEAVQFPSETSMKKLASLLWEMEPELVKELPTMAQVQVHCALGWRKKSTPEAAAEVHLEWIWTHLHLCGLEAFDVGFTLAELLLNRNAVGHAFQVHAIAHIHWLFVQGSSGEGLPRRVHRACMRESIFVEGAQNALVAADKAVEWARLEAAGEFCQVARPKAWLMQQKTDKLLKTLLVTKPQLSSFMVLLGWYYEERGQIGKAARCYQKAIDPEDEDGDACILAELSLALLKMVRRASLPDLRRRDGLAEEALDYFTEWSYNTDVPDRIKAFLAGNPPPRPPAAPMPAIALEDAPPGTYPRRSLTAERAPAPAENIREEPRHAPRPVSVVPGAEDGGRDDQDPGIQRAVEESLRECSDPLVAVVNNPILMNQQRLALHLMAINDDEEEGEQRELLFLLEFQRSSPDSNERLHRGEKLRLCREALEAAGKPWVLEWGIMVFVHPSQHERALEKLFRHREGGIFARHVLVTKTFLPLVVESLEGCTGKGGKLKSKKELGEVPMPNVEELQSEEPEGEITNEFGITHCLCQSAGLVPQYTSLGLKPSIRTHQVTASTGPARNPRLKKPDYKAFSLSDSSEPGEQAVPQEEEDALFLLEFQRGPAELQLRLQQGSLLQACRQALYDANCRWLLEDECHFRMTVFVHPNQYHQALQLLSQYKSKRLFPRHVLVSKSFLALVLETVKGCVGGGGTLKPQDGQKFLGYVPSPPRPGSSARRCGQPRSIQSDQTAWDYGAVYTSNDLVGVVVGDALNQSQAAAVDGENVTGCSSQEHGPLPMSEEALLSKDAAVNGQNQESSGQADGPLQSKDATVNSQNQECSGQADGPPPMSEEALQSMGIVVRNGQIQENMTSSSGPPPMSEEALQSMGVVVRNGRNQENMTSSSGQGDGPPPMSEEALKLMGIVVRNGFFCGSSCRREKPATASAASSRTAKRNPRFCAEITM